MAHISLEWLTSLIFVYSLMRQTSYSNSNLFSFLADHSHYKLLIERLQLVSTKAKEDPSRDASDFMTVEDEVMDLTPETNNVCTFDISLLLVAHNLWFKCFFIYQRNILIPLYLLVSMCEK